MLAEVKYQLCEIAAQFILVFLKPDFDQRSTFVTKF